MSDVWWKAVTQILPNGPWPGLVILHIANGKIRWGEENCATLIRVPGPVEEKWFFVAGSGYHFDPIWWRDATGYRASCNGLPNVLKRRDITYTPNIGPAAGALQLLQACYQGFIPHGSPESPTGGYDLVDAIIRGQADWTPWSQPIRSKITIPPGEEDNVVVALLQCIHPIAPYPELWSTDTAIRMLTPRMRTVGSPQGQKPIHLVIATFDSDGCHIGTLHSTQAGEALTRLSIITAPMVAEGHLGP